MQMHQIENIVTVIGRIIPTVFRITKHGQRVQEGILRICLVVYSYGINIIPPSKINRAEIQRVDASCKANIRSGVRNLFERASHSKCSVQLIVVICGKLQRILTRLGYVMQTNYSIIFINRIIDSGIAFNALLGYGLLVIILIGQYNRLQILEKIALGAVNGNNNRLTPVVSATERDRPDSVALL